MIVFNDEKLEGFVRMILLNWKSKKVVTCGGLLYLMPFSRSGHVLIETSKHVNPDRFQ